MAITEEMPVEPIRSWTDRLASTTNIPLFSVDTACVVPMQIVRMAHDRAFEFRQATQSLYGSSACIARGRMPSCVW